MTDSYIKRFDDVILSFRQSNNVPAEDTGNMQVIQPLNYCWVE